MPNSSTSDRHRRDLLAEFDSFRELLDHFTGRLSEEGIRFATDVRVEIGVELPFRVRIRDGFSVLRGEGEVVALGDDGLTLRFAYLDQPSLKLLPKLIEHYQRQGVPLLELPAPPASAIDEAIRDEVEALFGEDLPGAAAVEVEEEPVGLTLDDLEAEFRATQAVEPSTEEVEAVEPEVETEADMPTLVEAAELSGETRDPLEAARPTDIRIEDLLGEQAPEELPEAPTGASLEEPEAPLDPGLAWLPAESEKQSQREFWIILLLVLLGALLGAVFYFLFLRPAEQGSAEPSESASALVRSPPAAERPGRGLGGASAAELSKLDEHEVDAGALTRQGDEAEPDPGARDARLPVSTGRQLTGVDRITWDERAGETVIILWADGSFRAEQIEGFRLVGETPREVVRIRGVSRPCPDQRLQVDTGHVRSIRTGLHDRGGVRELHVVADLVDGDVAMRRTEADGEQLRLFFSRAG